MGSAPSSTTTTTATNSPSPQSAPLRSAPIDTVQAQSLNDASSSSPTKKTSVIQTSTSTSSSSPLRKESNKGMGNVTVIDRKVSQRNHARTLSVTTEGQDISRAASSSLSDKRAMSIQNMFGGIRSKSSSVSTIERRKTYDHDPIKLALYGSVNSGKTTLIKALKLLYAAEKDISPEERRRRVEEVRKTVILSAREVVMASETSSWSPDAADAARKFLGRTSKVGIALEASLAELQDEESEQQDGKRAENVATLATDEDIANEIRMEEQMKLEAKAQAESLIPKVVTAKPVSEPKPQYTPSSNVSTSFNSTVTSNVGRIVYNPKKHSEPFLSRANPSSSTDDNSQVSPKKSSTVVIQRKDTASSINSGNTAYVPILSVPPKKTSETNPISPTNSNSASSSTTTNAQSDTVTLRGNGISSPVIATPKDANDDDDVRDLPVAEHVTFDAEIVDSLKVLYSSEDFQRARLQASVDGYSGADHLAGNLDNIASPSYDPGADYLCARTVNEDLKEVLEINIQNTPIQICDMSSRNESLPLDWEEEDISAVVFLAALDIYDQPKKVAESRARFKHVCKKYKSKPIVLLLNKVDLFKEKVRVVPFYEKGLRNEEYKGLRPENAVSQPEFDKAVKEVQQYIMNDYHKLWKRKTHEESEIYIHFTQSTAPEQISAIFKAAKDSLLRNNLKMSGFV